MGNIIAVYTGLVDVLARDIAQWCSLVGNDIEYAACH